MIKKPSITKGVRVKECLELMHTNMYEPFNIRAYGEHGYFITFIDDYFRYGYVYLMHKDFNGLDKFKEFK